MPSNEQTWLGVGVVMWLGMNGVDLLNFDYITLGKDHVQEKSQMMSNT